MRNFNTIRIFIGLSVICGFGCEPAEITITKKSSYADLLVTYNAEVETLDNLEEKRKKLLAEHAEKAQLDAFKSALGSLESIGKPNTPSSPNDALDLAVAAAEGQAKALEQARKSTNAQPALADYPQELKQKLSELDAEIVKQKERVERARKNRDAAETK